MSTKPVCAFLFNFRFDGGLQPGSPPFGAGLGEDHLKNVFRVHIATVNFPLSQVFLYRPIPLNKLKFSWHHFKYHKIFVPHSLCGQNSIRYLQFRKINVHSANICSRKNILSILTKLRSTRKLYTSLKRRQFHRVDGRSPRGSRAECCPRHIVLRDFRLPPRCRRDMRSSGVLRSVEW